MRSMFIVNKRSATPEAYPQAVPEYHNLHRTIGTDVWIETIWNTAQSFWRLYGK